ncbi:MAG: molybdate ABC transporter substrate-binding protein [Chloroflexota bacterium]|nr:molybdate ABC transporter substrate-binding protein [Chloroflexota bacterium]
MTKYLFALMIGLAVLLGACGGGDNATTTPSATPMVAVTATPSPKPLSGSITVFAASSLTDAFNEIGTTFKSANPGATVTFNFGGSSTLRSQLEQGATGDIFASADTTQMGLAKTSGVVASDGTVFAHNRLVVIVPKANPAGIATRQDLARSGIKIVLADTTVPVGKYARAFLTAASADPAYGSGYSDKVLANVVSNTSNVKEVTSAVQLNEADAGIVYTTDVTAALAPEVTTIAIPDSVNQIATYPIAVTTNSSAKTVAQAFIDFVTSSAGQSILVSHGFIKATS